MRRLDLGVFCRYAGIITLVLCFTTISLAVMPIHPSVIEKYKNDPEKLDLMQQRMRSISNQSLSSMTRADGKRDLSIGIEARDDSIGTNFVPVILANLADRDADVENHTPAVFSDLLFSRNPNDPRSMYDYFQEVSYNALEPDEPFLTVNGEVFGWYDLPANSAEYADDISLFMEDLIEATDDAIDYSEFDHNGDGIVDSLYVVFSGPDFQETGNFENMSSANHFGFSPITVDNVVIDFVVTVPEIHGYVPLYDPRRGGDNLNSIGVFVHEYGHVLGLPDLYDTNNIFAGGEYSGEGIGIHGLMAAGSYGFDYLSPHYPVHPIAWCKEKLDWIEYDELTSGERNKALEQIEDTGQAIKVYRKDFPSQYFLLENRQPVGFDRNIEDGGILITKINEDVLNKSFIGFQGTFEDYNIVQDLNIYKGVTVMEADGRNDLLNNTDFGTKTDFWSAATATVFSPNTNPNSDYDPDFIIDVFGEPEITKINGPSNISVSKISASGSTMTMDISVLDAKLVNLVSFGQYALPDSDPIPVIGINASSSGDSLAGITLSLQDLDGNPFPPEIIDFITADENSGIAVYMDNDDDPTGMNRSGVFDPDIDILIPTDFSGDIPQFDTMSQINIPLESTDLPEDDITSGNEGDDFFIVIRTASQIAPSLVGEKFTVKIANGGVYGDTGAFQGSITTNPIMLLDVTSEIIEIPETILSNSNPLAVLGLDLEDFAGETWDLLKFTIEDIKALNSPGSGITYISENDFANPSIDAVSGFAVYEDNGIIAGQFDVFDEPIILENTSDIAVGTSPTTAGLSVLIKLPEDFVISPFDVVDDVGSPPFDYFIVIRTSSTIVHDDRFRVVLEEDSITTESGTLHNLPLADEFPEIRVVQQVSNLVEPDQAISTFSPPAPVLGINLASGTREQLERITFIVNEQAVNTITPSDFAEVDLDEASGFALYTDDGDVEGSYDLNDSVIELERLPITVDWPVVRIEVPEGVAIPLIDRDDEEGFDFYLTIRTSGTISGGDSFSISMISSSIQIISENDPIISGLTTNPITAVASETEGLTFSDQGILPNSVPTPIFGLNLGSGAGDEFVSLTFRITSVSGTITASDFAPAGIGDSSGYSIFRDNGSREGELDADDTVIRLDRPPFISGFPVVKIQLPEGVQIPTRDAEEYAGSDFYLMLRTSSTIESGDSFSVFIDENPVEFISGNDPGFISGSSFTMKVVDQCFDVTSANWQTEALRLQQALPPSSPPTAIIGINLASGTMERLSTITLNFDDLNGFELVASPSAGTLSDLLALSVDGGSGIALYRNDGANVDKFEPSGDSVIVLDEQPTVLEKPGGYEVKLTLPSNPPERIQAGDRGDLVDNDGDGRIDEELEDGRDNDGDGKVDEDMGELTDYYVVIRTSSTFEANDKFKVSINTGAIDFENSVYGNSPTSQAYVETTAIIGDIFAFGDILSFNDLVRYWNGQYYINKQIDSNSGPIDIIGINAFTGGQEDVYFKSIKLEFLSVPSDEQEFGTFTITDLNPLSTSRTSGVALYLDNNEEGEDGIFDPTDILVDVLLPSWSGLRTTLEVDEDAVDEPVLIPSQDTDEYIGDDFFIVIWTSNTAEPLDEFNVTIPKDGIKMEKRSGTGTETLTNSVEFTTFNILVNPDPFVEILNLTSVNQRIDPLSGPFAVLGINLFDRGHRFDPMQTKQFDAIRINFTSVGDSDFTTSDLRGIFLDSPVSSVDLQRSDGLTLYQDDDTEEGDFQDDDGDSFIDEEYANNFDDDGDGLVDEDLGDLTPAGENGIFDIHDNPLPLFVDNYGHLVVNYSSIANKFSYETGNRAFSAKFELLTWVHDERHGRDEIINDPRTFGPGLAHIQAGRTPVVYIQDTPGISPGSVTNTIDRTGGGFYVDFGDDYPTAPAFDPRAVAQYHYIHAFPDDDVGVMEGIDYYVVLRTSSSASTGDDFIVTVPANGVEYSEYIHPFGANYLNARVSDNPEVSTNVITVSQGTDDVFDVFIGLQDIAPEDGTVLPSDRLAVLGINAFSKTDQDTQTISEITVTLSDGRVDDIDFDPEIDLAPLLTSSLGGVLLYRDSDSIAGEDGVWDSTDTLIQLQSADLEYTGDGPFTLVMNPTTPIAVPSNDGANNLGLDFFIVIKISETPISNDRFTVGLEAGSIVSNAGTSQKSITSRPLVIAAGTGGVGEEYDVYAYPNPAPDISGDCHFVYRKVYENIRLKVYNLAGELVYNRNIVGGQEFDFNTNKLVFNWACKNNDGERLASGVYFYFFSFTDPITGISATVKDKILIVN